MAAWTLPPSWKDWCALSDPEISGRSLPDRPCAVCGATPVVAHGLCAKHDQRLRQGRPLVEVWEEHPEMGVLPRGDDWVLCLECGRHFKTLSSHLKTHGLTAAEFRLRHQLPRQEPLMCDDLRAQTGRMSAERVGTAQWRRFEQARDAALPFSQRAAATAPRTVGGRRLLSEKSTGRPRTRTCPMCGKPLKPRKRFCSEACATAHRRQATHARDARNAGEPLDFTRRPGAGVKVTADMIEPLCGITWNAWRQRVRAGTAPQHDGRVAGQRFWWESTIENARKPQNSATATYADSLETSKNQPPKSQNRPLGTAQPQLLHRLR